MNVKSVPWILIEDVGWLDERQLGAAGRPVEEQADVVGYLRVFCHVGFCWRGV